MKKYILLICGYALLIGAMVYMYIHFNSMIKEQDSLINYLKDEISDTKEKVDDSKSDIDDIKDRLRMY